MQKFLINSIRDWAGRKYWVVNYPKDRPPWRVQRKFNTLERAEEFLAEIKREWARTGKIKLGLDRDLHCDVLRAVKLLNGVAHATLEGAAYVYLQCRSAREKRGLEYEVASERTIELGPRFFLLVQNEAKARKITINEAVEGLLGEVAILRGVVAVRQQSWTEEREYLELKKRNDVEWEKLRQLRREERILQEMRGVNMIFEQGRQSVLLRKAEYQRRWRERKKAREREVKKGGF